MIRTRPTRDETRYAALREIGCVACVLSDMKTQCGKLTMHHLVDKGYRKHSGGNQATIPLGEWHHQGIPFIDRTATWMRNMYGPSMVLESKAFAELYGGQRELLAETNRLLSGNTSVAQGK